jgi:trimethylamine--corrinoid protein Co-methyltransferase
MNTEQIYYCAPHFRILTTEQVKQIHQASLEILATVGIRVNNAEGVQALREAGCQVKDDNLILIPEELVEHCIQSAPSCITIYNRHGEAAMRLEGRNTYFGLGTDLLRTYDLQTGQLQMSRLQDVVNAARVADYCEQIDFVASYALPQDVPTNTMYVESFRALVTNTTKPIFFTAAGQEDLAVILDMAATVSGGIDALRERPFLIHYAESLSPLIHSNSGVQKLFHCADNRIPVTYTQGMLAGASGPVTLAGAIAVANAEALSGVVLHQVRAPGAPIVSGLAVVPLDMRSTIFSYGSPEYRLTDAAYADLYHYYRLPMWGTAGCSDSNILDQQAAAEAAISILMSALSGVNLVHDVGYLGQGTIGNPAAIVMCNELISYVRRMMRGFEISQDTIPIDLIRRLGPGGNYLVEKHTAEHHRLELWRPQCFNRENPDAWLKMGSKAYGETIVQRTMQILATHRPEPLPVAVSQSIDEIARRAVQALAGQYFAT